jgi:hypothetical protein
MNTPTYTLQSVRAGLVLAGNMTEFTRRHKLSLRTVMHIKSIKTESVKQSTLDKVAKALKRSGITLDSE